MRANLIFPIILIFFLASCEENLELRPKMQVSSEEAFANRENIEAALNGCYDALQLQHYYGRNLIIVGDLASDNSIANGTKVEYYDIDKNSLLANNILVEGIWADIYAAVNRVNVMLNKLDPVNFLPDEEKKDYIGQLHFLRALHYFNLVRLYGPVPLKILPTLSDSPENFLPRSPLDSVYNLILFDLEHAKANIINQKKEKATREAVIALLSSVYLTLEKPDSALSIANELLGSNPPLENSYKNLFSEGEPSPEILFYIPFSASDKNRLAEYNFPNTLGGRHENAPSLSLINIEENDLRKPLLASFHDGKYYTTKYPDLTTGADRVIVFRMAELYSIRAEALFQLDSAAHLPMILSDINRIRERAGLLPVLPDTITSLRNILEREKQIEFAFEGKRWFDLIRTNRATEVVSTVTESYQMLFPIPLSELSSNFMIGVENQNEGY